MSIETSWCVITGAPSSGKTTLIEALKCLGFQTQPEIARSYFEQHRVSGKKLELSTPKLLAMQNDIFDLKFEREASLSQQTLYFFDRGLPDSLAYFRYFKLPDQHLQEKLNKRKYKHVFFLEGLPVVQDAIRKEDEQTAQTIGTYIYESYRKLGYTPTLVKAKSIQERVEDILLSIE